MWIIKVGDVVAVRIELTIQLAGSRMVPIHKPYDPVRFFAMYQERDSTTEERWLVMRCLSAKAKFLKTPKPWSYLDS
jgi:hypothetical protein